MSQMDDMYETIEDYLKNRMSASDRLAFENQMNTDPLLKEEVEMQQMAMNVLEHAYLKDVSELIKSEIAKKPRSNSWRWMGLAVVVSSLAIGGWYFNRKEANRLVVEKDQNIEIQKETKEQGVEPIHNSIPVVDSVLEKNQKIVVTNRTENIPSIKENKVIESNKVEKTVLQDYLGNEKTSVPKDIEMGKPNEVTPIEKETPVQEKEPTCNYNPNVKVSTKKTDFGASNGEINMVNLNKDELVFLLNDVESYNTDFYDLNAGKYRVSVKKDGCTYEIGTYEVLESKCEAPKDLSFNPSIDDELRINLSTVVDSEIIIYDKMGNLLFQQMSENTDEFVWDGKCSNGRQAEIGLHYVYIKYVTGESCKYNVVISN